MVYYRLVYKINGVLSEFHVEISNWKIEFYTESQTKKRKEKINHTNGTEEVYKKKIYIYEFIYIYIDVVRRTLSNKHIEKFTLKEKKLNRIFV